jgi:hypothetical protein
VRPLPREIATLAGPMVLCLALSIGVIAVVPPGAAVLVLALVAASVGIALLSPRDRAFVALGALFTLALFAPPIWGGQNSAPIRAEDAVVAGCLALFLVGGSWLEVGFLERGFVVLVGVDALAMLMSSMYTATLSSSSDFFFFIRLGKYMLMVLIVRHLAALTGGLRARLVSVVAVLIAGFALIGLAQYFGFAAAIRAFPAPTSRSDLLLSGASWRRAVGSVGNSNYFGFICSLGCVVAAAQIAHARTALRQQTIAGLALATCAAGVLVSGSRTALLAGSLMFAVVILPALRHMRLWRNLAIVVLVIIVGTAIFGGTFQNQPIVGRFDLWSSSSSGDTLVSFSQRKQVWAGALEQVQGHWLFGLGPGKGVLSQWVDNDLIRMFRDFGAAGASAYAFVLVWWTRRLVTLRRVRGGVPGGHLLALAVVVGTATMGGGSDVFYQPQVMGIVLLLLGLLTVSAREEDAK